MPREMKWPLAPRMAYTRRAVSDLELKQAVTPTLPAAGRCPGQCELRQERLLLPIGRGAETKATLERTFVGLGGLATGDYEKDGHSGWHRN